MKKLLLSTVAVIGVVSAATPASAQIDVTIGGHTKNYIGWMSQDDGDIAEPRSFDMIRESEIHVNAEGTADNGLTYGFHVELEADAGDDQNTVEESYLYLSSNLGRVNLGSEDGANYLLQVAAPSADANIDGIRQYVQPVNYMAFFSTSGTDINTNAVDDGVELATAAAVLVAADGFDYDNDATGYAEKLTYLSPVWSGFQFGVSYTPDVNDNGSSTGLAGFNTDDVANTYGSAYEGAARYEGQFNNLGFAVGAGYTQVDLEEDGGIGLDDYKEWNVGVDFNVGAFGVGAVWTENNNGVDVGDEDRTFVVGADYTTGPFQFGASYYDRDDEFSGIGTLETERYSGGVVYTAAPGLSFRGSINFIDHEIGTDSVDATSVLGGVQLNF